MMARLSLPSAVEIAQALYGTWRFARLDRNALRYFDLSHGGVWRSFWAAALCYPGFLALLWLRLDNETLARAGFTTILLVESIGYAIAWTGFPLLALGLCRRIGREEGGFDFIAAYNLSQVPQTLLFLVLGLVSLALPPLTAGYVELGGDIAVLGYEWFIASVAVGAGGRIAAALVALDFTLGVAIALTAARLY